MGLLVVGPVFITSPVMGHVVSNGLELLGTGRNARLDASLASDVTRMVELGEKQANQLTSREMKHVAAVDLWAKG